MMIIMVYCCCSHRRNVLKCFVLASYIMNVTMREGGNSTTSYLSAFIIILLITMCLPDAMELVESVTNSLREGMEWAARWICSF